MGELCLKKKKEIEGGAKERVNTTVYRGGRRILEDCKGTPRAVLGISVALRRGESEKSGGKSEDCSSSISLRRSRSRSRSFYHQKTTSGSPRFKEKNRHGRALPNQTKTTNTNKEGRGKDDGHKMRTGEKRDHGQLGAMIQTGRD